MSEWCIPKKENADFIAHMEDVLDVYKMPYNEEIPVICMDEEPKQLLSDTRTPVPISKGHSKKIDYEYVRHGTVSNFIFVEPLAGWRRVSVRDRRTAVDWAEEVAELVEKNYPEVQKIILVCDNLNTHKISSFYKAFTPERARNIAKKLEIHYTPKHGSWLNIAECEIHALATQCLKRRIGEKEIMEREINAWETERNEIQKGVDWQFTTEEARVKLKRLYPKIKMD